MKTINLSLLLFSLFVFSQEYQFDKNVLVIPLELVQKLEIKIHGKVIFILILATIIII